MPWWKPFARRESDLERELRTHLDLEAEEQQEAGLSSNEARYAARRVLGNTTRIKEEIRDMSPWSGLEPITRDVLYAFRGMRRNPAFTAVAVLSLALGIGATTAIFSLMNAILLRPLPVADPDRLVLLKPQLRAKPFVLFNPIFEEIREHQKSLGGMFAVSDEPYLKVALEGGPPAYVRGSFVSGNYFQVLGLSPALGRLLTPADDRPLPSACAIVISDSFWTERFRRRATVIGQVVRLREKDCTIVGVVPPEFHSHQAGYDPDIWAPVGPMTDPQLLASRSMAFFSGLMGRLRPGTTLEQAQTELTTLYQRIQATGKPSSPFPGDSPPAVSDFRINLIPGAQGLDTVRRRYGQPLLLMFAVVAVVLTIAAVNVANLLLARGAARQQEFATRAALGAGQGRLLRQLATEGAVLAGLGGVLGIALAWAGAPALTRLLRLPYMAAGLDVSPDRRVLGAAIAAMAFAALLAGLLPGLRLRWTSLQLGMSASGRTTGSRPAQHLARALVAGQLALSLLLVSSAGLLLRTMLRLLAVDPGFDASHVVLMDVRDTEPSARFGETDSPEQKAHRAELYRSLDRQLNSLPGVQAAGVSWLGLFGGSYVGLNLYDTERPSDRRFTLVDYVSPRYFETIGMSVLRGRVFTDTDREGTQRVAVVNEAFVRERIRDKEAIGRSFVMTYADDRRPFTIVGVVRDAKYNDLREPKTEPMMWVPLAQAPFKISSVSLRVRPGSDTAVIREARAALASVSPHLMVRTVTSLDAQVSQSTAREQSLLALVAGFGGLSLLLSAVGLGGTLAFAVARRTREIGVRLALGAQRGTVLRMVLAESLRLVAAGVLVGIPLSWYAGRALRTFLFGVDAYDLPVLAGACAVLAAVALMAAFVPARRASHVDPILALRSE